MSSSDKKKSYISIFRPSNNNKSKCSPFNFRPCVTYRSNLTPDPIKTREAFRALPFERAIGWKNNKWHSKLDFAHFPIRRRGDRLYKPLNLMG